MAETEKTVLQVPLEIGPDGRLLTVPLDSDDDVAQCLLAIGRTRPGDRWDEPTMGAEPLTFGQAPVDTTELTRALTRYEARRPVAVIQATDRLAAAVDVVAVELTIAYEQESPRG